MKLACLIQTLSLFLECSDITVAQRRWWESCRGCFILKWLFLMMMSPVKES